MFHFRRRKNRIAELTAQLQVMDERVASIERRIPLSYRSVFSAIMLDNIFGAGSIRETDPPKFVTADQLDGLQRQIRRLEAVNNKLLKKRHKEAGKCRAKLDELGED